MPRYGNASSEISIACSIRGPSGRTRDRARRGDRARTATVRRGRQYRECVAAGRSRGQPALSIEIRAHRRIVAAAGALARPDETSPTRCAHGGRRAVSRPVRSRLRGEDTTLGIAGRTRGASGSRDDRRATRAGAAGDRDDRLDGRGADGRRAAVQEFDAAAAELLAQYREHRRFDRARPRRAASARGCRCCWCSRRW